jgi:serine/threonine protein kinase
MYTKAKRTILAKLKHPGVVKLLDCFEEDHRGYLVLEFVEGTPIHDLVSRKGPLNEAEGSREIAISICQVMTYLHSFSPAIIHGDLTPENLILKKKMARSALSTSLLPTTTQKKGN